MSVPTSTPKKPTDDPLLAVLEPSLKVGAFAGKIDPGLSLKVLRRLLFVPENGLLALLQSKNQNRITSLETVYHIIEFQTCHSI